MEGLIQLLEQMNVKMGKREKAGSCRPQSELHSAAWPVAAGGMTGERWQLLSGVEFGLVLMFLLWIS